ncbi:amidase [Intrasporangium sp.]|uniref:amidase n=1 Tax=Intrasporangium sp. TaxID=1925024 RepID=UPI002939CCA7|nr:amidase [Intrasporangium sp.]MDV3219885.1 amidase [Intrasporangium sp.]
MLGPFSSALDWSAAIRNGEVSPLEVLDLYLERIDRLDPSLNSFLFRADDEARAAARAMGDRLARGEEDLPPFFGVPLSVKGLNDVRGWVNRYCSFGTPDVPAEADDPYVARLRAAGFVFVGLTTSPEFGSISVTESAMHGATRNPWDLTRSPGGSSGGAAAGLAAGLVPIAHGSDGGGSIREPASFTGLVGLKPSRGRVADFYTPSPGFATEGVLSRTVADTAAALDILSVQDPRRWYVLPAPGRPFADAVTEDPAPQRIGVLRRPGLPVPVEDEAMRAVDAAAALLSDLGHKVFEVDLPGFDPELIERLFTTIWIASHGAFPGVDFERTEPLTRELHRRAAQLSVPAVVEAVAAMQRVTAQCLTPWSEGRLDALITPTTPSGPPPIGWLFEEVEVDPMSVLFRAYHHAGFTSTFNMFGLPAISLPLHVRADGLPGGVQFVGAPRADWELLQLAGQVERAAPWHQRVPVLALADGGVHVA